MQDTKKLKLLRGMHDLTDAQVYDAIKVLSKNDCIAFLQLHEGDLPYIKKPMRIYKANAFGNGEESWVSIARISGARSSDVDLRCIKRFSLLFLDLEIRVPDAFALEERSPPRKTAWCIAGPVHAIHSSFTIQRYALTALPIAL